MAKQVKIPLHRKQVETLKSRSRFVAMVAGTGGGKALHVETPIPTPDGFVKMLDLKVGDTIYDDKGQECRVTYTSPIYLGNKCFRLVFDDGSTIIADAEHIWVTENADQRKNKARRVKSPNTEWVRKRPQCQPRADHSTVATQEILHTLIHKRGAINHSIGLTAIEGRKKQLLVSPYILGVWLGDGVATDAIIITADEEILEHIKDEGEKVGIGYGNNSGRAKNYRIGGVNGRGKYHLPNGRFHSGDCLKSRLRELKILTDKHIPIEYLFSSFEQRLALLQGLMDSDGYIRDSGSCEFTTSSKRLAEDVQALLASLGIKSFLTTKIPKYQNKEYKEAYRIKFTTVLPVFKLKRKAQRLPNRVRPNTTRRFIVACEEIASVPTRCISVNSSSSQYLCGHQFIATHNTFFGPVWLFCEMKKWRGEEFLVVAPTYKMLQRATLPSFLRFFREIGQQGEFKKSIDQYVLRDGGTVWFGSADRPESLEGPHVKAAWLDEAGQMKAMTWVVIQARVGQKMGRVLLTTTPYALNWLYHDFYKNSQEDSDYDVIQFDSIANPFYPKEEFERARRTLDAKTFDMRYRGQFRKMAGLVYPDFDTDNVVDPFELPLDWERWLAVDFGFTNPFCCLWFARDRDDNYYIYREHYRAETLLRDHAKAVAEASDQRDKEDIGFGFADPSDPQQIADLREALAANGMAVAIWPAFRDVRKGIELTSELVRAKRLKVFKTCRAFLDEIEVYHWPEPQEGRETKELPVKEYDHAMDAARYGIATKRIGYGVRQTVGVFR